jgi:hypothetical protein
MEGFCRKAIEVLPNMGHMYMQDWKKRDGQLFATPYSSLPNKRVVEINFLVGKNHEK